ncbi:MAG: hypothetical protein AAF942_15995 [Pseudomonadota bacterium]
MKVEQLDDRKLRIGEKVIQFDYEIADVLTMSDRVIVLFDVLSFAEDDPDTGRNVFAYDANGNELWRIEDARVMVEGELLEKVSHGYTELHRTQDKTLHAWVKDWRYDLNTETGEISNPKYVR